jgi:hypothetical protein
VAHALAFLDIVRPADASGGSAALTEVAFEADLDESCNSSEVEVFKWLAGARGRGAVVLRPERGVRTGEDRFPKPTKIRSTSHSSHQPVGRHSTLPSRFTTTYTQRHRLSMSDQKPIALEQLDAEAEADRLLEEDDLAQAAAAGQGGRKDEVANLRGEGREFEAELDELEGDEGLSLPRPAVAIAPVSNSVRQAVNRGGVTHPAQREGIESSRAGSSVPRCEADQLLAWFVQVRPKMHPGKSIQI